MHVVLGSASPARLATLRAAGVEPEVIVSGVAEDDVVADSPAALAGVLAALKGDAVAARVTERCSSGGSGAGSAPAIVVIGADSVLEFDGRPLGKPGTAEVARERWRAMRGSTGVLHTGHRVVLVDAAGTVLDAVTEVASTTVRFADLPDAEIDAYVATGEPLQVAGGFTVDGLGGPFVEHIDGDFHNVVGLSLPLLRRILATWRIGWHSLRS